MGKIKKTTGIFNLVTIEVLTSTFNYMLFYFRIVTQLLTLLTLSQLYDFQYDLLFISSNVPSKFRTSTRKIGHRISRQLVLRTNVNNNTLKEPSLKHLTVKSYNKLG